MKYIAENRKRLSKTETNINFMKNIFNFLIKNDIGNPPWDYYFLQNLDEKEYPNYLAKLFNLNTGEKLPLKYDFKTNEWVIDKNKCKTFNQKIQWIKLYGITDLMRDCTDKIKVRDYVAEKIGSESLKPVLKICDNFDEIDFNKIPNAFVIKCNHGCKWQYIIKDKKQFLNNQKLFQAVNPKITGWLEQEYWCWGGFEMQYATSRRMESPDSTLRVRTRFSEDNVNDRTKSEVNNLSERKGCQDGIEPKILIEPLLRDEIDKHPLEIEVYCFNGEPKIFVNVKYKEKREICYYDENFNFIDLLLHPDGNNKIIKEKADNLLYRTIDLSIKLSKDFSFVRVDWIIYKNQLYFNELTFTPYSGFIKFDKNWNLKLGKYMRI